jgi:peptidyl-dipeptidase Dcp
LSGLPESAIESAEQTAKEKNKQGWIFTLQYISFLPFMTYSDNRELRKQLYIANHSKCSKDNEYNNLEIIKKNCKH